MPHRAGINISRPKKGEKQGREEAANDYRQKRGKATPRCLSCQYKLALFIARLSLFVLRSETIPESIVKKPVYPWKAERDGKRKLNSRLPSESSSRKEGGRGGGNRVSNSSQERGTTAEETGSKRGKNTADWILETPKEEEFTCLSVLS